MSSSPDHLYLDLFTVNGDNNGSGIKTALNFNETRTTPILSNPSNYFLSIVRFECDTPSVSLPVFMPTILIDGVNTNPNTTSYTITLAKPNSTTKLLDAVYSVNVTWVPEDQTAPPPNNRYDPVSGALIAVDYTTGYYNAYSARWFLACCNNALAQVWNFITASAQPSNAPYLIIDPITNIITLLTPYTDNTIVPAGNNNFAPVSYNSSAQVANGNGFYPTYLGLPSIATAYNPVKFSMFMNEPLANLFSGFTSVYYGNTLTAAAINASDGSIGRIAGRFWLFNYYLQPIIYSGLNISTPTVGGSQFITMTSDYSPVPMWNPVSSIIFTSSLLPIKISMSSVPAVYNSNSFDQTYAQNGNNSQVTNMLSDIQVGLVSGNEYKPSVLYVPASEYRLIDMLGSNPINQASFGVSFKTKFGVVIPFKLGAQCGANIKILFRRKRYNLGNLPPYDTN